MTSAARSIPEAPFDLGLHLREARLRAHIETRLLSCDHLLARAHGRAAAWFANPDRLALPQPNRDAIDQTNELSITLLKVRVDALRSYRHAMNTMPVRHAVQHITKEYELFVGSLGDPETRASSDEANLALGAWDGPENVLAIMEGAHNAGK